MGKAVKTAPVANEDVDRIIGQWFDIVDVKCIVVLIKETHDLHVSEMDVLMRAADLAGVVA